MGKYDPLKQYLLGSDEDSWEVSFSQVEKILGFALPDSAHTYQAWWANQTGSAHTQTSAWRDAGFATRDLDLRRKSVRFERIGTTVAPRLEGEMSGTEKLWMTAATLTETGDREKLLEMALTALIQREAALTLARMGGTMPDAWAPQRARPDA